MRYRFCLVPDFDVYIRTLVYSKPKTGMHETYDELIYGWFDVAWLLHVYLFSFQLVVSLVYFIYLFIINLLFIAHVAFSHVYFLRRKFTSRHITGTKNGARNRSLISVYSRFMAPIFWHVRHWTLEGTDVISHHILTWFNDESTSRSS